MNICRLTAPILLKRAGFNDFLNNLNQVEKNQWKSKQEIKEIQAQKLSALLKHAAKQVPYYNELFKRNNIQPSHSDPFMQLQKTPVLSKEMHQEAGDSIFAENFEKRNLIKRSTSGSTGVPTIVYLDHQRAHWSAAYNLRHNRWAGADWGCKMADI